ncbi:MAG TPA: polysaccharide pyruvyl transferase family protein, partial [Desulfitobacteriaceae bacterium]|nr:polysaccharide pyruvyl transferase family protein [Desulfitobacteriaceae bacterium]
FNLKIKRATPLSCEICAIGSGLGNFMLSDQLPLRAAQIVCGAIYGEVNVWGTGFIARMEDKPFFRKKLNFHAIRGELSKQRVEKILGHKIETVTGDAGLLADVIVKPVAKKYAVGIIPHFREQDDPVFAQMKEKYANSTIINLRDEPIGVIEQMSACEAIISSSLHGLIVADCYGIPNKWIKVTDKLKGDGFKFLDYYSAYGLTAEPLDLKKESIPTINRIYDDYRVDLAVVNEKKKQLLACFPYKA